jgi:hypothetical protein
MCLFVYLTPRYGNMHWGDIYSEGLVKIEAYDYVGERFRRALTSWCHPLGATRMDTTGVTRLASVVDASGFRPSTSAPTLPLFPLYSPFCPPPQNNC